MSRLLIIVAVLLFILYLMKKNSPKKSLGGNPKAKPMPRRGKRSAHDVLGVSRGASDEEIRRAYQEKIRQYHPDKVASMADELQELAEQRTKELNVAYDELMNG